MWLVAVCAFSLPSGQVLAATFVVNPGDNIQAAIDAANPSDVISLSAGNHSIATLLDVPSGISVVGAGVGQTTLKFSGPGDETFFDLEDSSNVRIADMTIDGINSNASHAVSAAYGTGHTIENLRIRDLSGPESIGVFFWQDVDHSTIRNNTFESIGVDSFWGAAVRIAHDSSHNEIEYNTIDGVGRGGILANDGSHHLTIRHNTVRHIGENNPENPDNAGEYTPRLGIELWMGVNDSIVENNDVDHYISIDGSNRIAVRDNTIGQASGVNTRAFTGIEMVGGTGTPTQDIIVTGNQLIATTDADAPTADLGISVSGDGVVQHVLVEDNSIAGAGTWGVQIQGRDTPGATGGKQRLYITGNEFVETRDGQPGPYGEQGDAIRLNGDNGPINDLVITGNTITDNYGVALGVLTQGNVDDIRISGNIANNNAAGGNALTDIGNPELVATSIAPGSLTVTPNGATVELTVTFADSRVVDHAVWDFGNGYLPVTGTTILQALTNGDYEITVIAWDVSGNANLTTFLLTVPEPATSMLWLTGAAVVARRGNRPD